MSTILNALRRLEADSSGHTTQAGRAADPLPADELRDRILAEESAAQAGAAAHSEFNRAKRIVMFATAALLTLGLGVGAYTTYTTSSRVDSDPTAIDVTGSASLDSAPETENPPAGEAVAAVVSLQPTSGRAVVLPRSGAAALSNFATAQRYSRPEALAGNEANEIPSAEALSESEAESQPSIASVPVPDPVPMAVPMPMSVPMPTDAITDASTASPRPSVVSRPTTTPPPVREAATESLVGPTPTAPRVADEMALAAVTPTPATIAASSRRTVEAPETSPAETLEPRAAETRPPRNRPKPASAAPVPPPSVSAPEPRQVERLDRRGLPDLTVLRTAWHPDANRRSARIRLEASDEILTLREGDAVGGLVIQKISPSTVLFKAGDVEIRRRVGQPGSGG